jgi:hypothetical protein
MKNRDDHKAVDTQDKLYFASKWMKTDRLERLLTKYDHLFHWGGITQIMAYDKILNRYDDARRANDADRLEALRSDLTPFLATGHGKNIAAAISRVVKEIRA